MKLEDNMYVRTTLGYDYCDNKDVMNANVIANNFIKLNEDMDYIFKKLDYLESVNK